MFERKIGVKAYYYWTETQNGELISKSDLYAVRETMLRVMHEKVKACREEGVVFQPMIDQEGECAEWGQPERPKPEYLAYVEDETRSSTEVGLYWTLEDAINASQAYEERVFVTDPEKRQIFCIKEAH